MRYFLAISASLAIAALSDTTASAATSKVGDLQCDVSAGMGVVVGSHQDMTCTFTPSAPGSRETYVGKIDKFGINIGPIEKATLRWLVYSATGNMQQGLDGTYGGVSADATVAIGLGANILSGGEQGSLSLQPLSIEAEQGLNVAVGVSQLTLKKVPK